MSNLSDFMGQSMEKIRNMIDVNTIIGNPITTPDGTTLIPVSKVTFGFASGGSDVAGQTQPGLVACSLRSRQRSRCFCAAGRVCRHQ